MATCTRSEEAQGDVERQLGQQLASRLSRRALLSVAAAAAVARSLPLGAWAFQAPPAGYRLHRDILDGYYFFYPDTYTPVTTSGNDVFYRNPFIVDENLFVDISSPSSSRYTSVADLGPPEAAAKRLLGQFLEEFMSTRLGVRREAEIVSSAERTADDGKLYYDIQVRAKSFASRNQLAMTQKEVDRGMELEWDRSFTTVLGVANKRLYQLRLQTSSAANDKNPEALTTITRSFRCYELGA